MPRANLVETVLRVCRADADVAGGGPVVVAVSGGPDSTALLHALWRAGRRLRLDVTAAHLDHGMRAGSRRDAEVVAEMCRGLGIVLVTDRVAPGRRPRTEDAARRVRYRFLEEAAAAAGAGTIALGHTADDQAETVLLHLLRGTGLEGLAAMSVREGPRFRPLLGVWRTEVIGYCRRHRLTPVEDASNRSRRFTRNRVRLDLLPKLESYNPKVKAGLVRLADAARDEHEVIQGLAGEWLARQRRSLSRRSLAELPAAVQAEVLRRLWSSAAGDGSGRGDAAHLHQALSLIDDTRRRGMVDLGRGLHLYVDASRFYIATKPAT